MGCSLHKVPSLSNTAMRSLTGTNAADVGSVTRVTKSMICALLGDSCQYGKTSLAIAIDPVVTPHHNKQPNRIFFIIAIPKLMAGRVMDMHKIYSIFQCYRLLLMSGGLDGGEADMCVRPADDGLVTIISITWQVRSRQ